LKRKTNPQSKNFKVKSRMERVGRGIRQLPDCKGSSERERATSEFQIVEDLEAALQQLAAGANDLKK
jgi:hypothetical protein